MSDKLLSVEVDGVRYDMSPSDFTGLDELAVKRELGMTLVQVFRELSEEPSLYGLAALVWRYRVGEGETDLTFEQVASKVNVDVFGTLSDGSGDDDAPKASGGS